VICGIRSLEEEDIIFGKGRTRSEIRSYGVDQKYSDPVATRVSWVRPDRSKHVMGSAIDISFDMYTMNDWTNIRRLADELYIKWGGNWDHVDRCHFEM
jgi:hypothetical protein